MYFFPTFWRYSVDTVLSLLQRIASGLPKKQPNEPATNTTMMNTVPADCMITFPLIINATAMAAQRQIIPIAVQSPWPERLA